MASLRVPRIMPPKGGPEFLIEERRNRDGYSFCMCPERLTGDAQRAQLVIKNFFLGFPQEIFHITHLFTKLADNLPTGDRPKPKKECEINTLVRKLGISRLNEKFE